MGEDDEDREDDDIEIAAQTAEILAMWAVIRRSHQRLKARDKEIVTASLEWNKERLGFDGFDENPPEGRVAFVAHALTKLDWFQEMEDWATISSHTQVSLNIHRRKLDAYRKMRERDNLDLGDDLTVKQLLEVLQSTTVSSGGRRTQ